MEALVYSGPGRFEIGRLDAPEPGAGEAVVRVRASGLCHTDVEVLHGRYGEGAFPLVPGHEYAGTVEAVGPGVSDVIRPGDRVVIDPNISCGTCRACRRGLGNLCATLQAYGVTRDGGFAEYALVDAAALHPIGDMDFALAALAEPLGCVLNGLDAAGTDSVRDALLYGAGPIGLLMALALRERGVESVTVVDLDGSRREFAQGLGLDALPADDASLSGRPRSRDLAVDATGVVAVAAGLIDQVADGGAALLFGVCLPGETMPVSPHEIFRRQIRLVGAHSLNHNIPAALEVLRASGETMSRVVSHRVPLSDVAACLSGGVPAGAMKVQFAAG